MQSTPFLDAVLAWRAGGVWVEPPPARHDPPEWNDYGRRIEAVIRMCSSGAQAELPPKYVTIGDRKIPPPPGGPKPREHVKRHRAPKQRKTKEKSP
jgi:hypothetical protein